VRMFTCDVSHVVNRRVLCMYCLYVCCSCEKCVVVNSERVQLRLIAVLVYWWRTVPQISTFACYPYLLGLDSSLHALSYASLESSSVNLTHRDQIVRSPRSEINP
jgi:hypothetical protein